MITSVFVALAVIAIPTAFWLLTAPYPKYWSVITAVIGFTSLIIAVVRAYKADEEVKDSRDGLRQDIRDLISEIRQDRRGRQNTNGTDKESSK